jgi:peptidoglycan hydrolase CwlO-like protein
MNSLSVGDISAIVILQTSSGFCCEALLSGIFLFDPLVVTHSGKLRDTNFYIVLFTSILMVEAVVTSVLEEALRQASERIAKKITEGKRLTSIDVIILLLDQMNKRMEIMNESLNKRIDDLSASLNKRIDDTNKRIDDTNKRIDDIKEDLRLLHQEVSSIKSDIIALMREKLKTG